MSRGVLITLEGCDGCGKSTQAALLCERLAACGLPAGPAAAPGTVIREPGATPAGEAIRDVLLHGPSQMAPWTETLLYAAARAELVQTVLLPELAAGRILVLDRFVDSSLAYQGFARRLGVDEVLAVNEPALQGLLPDLTLVLDVDPVVGLARAGGGERAPTASRRRGSSSSSAWPPASPPWRAAGPSASASSTASATSRLWPPTSRPPPSRPWPTPACGPATEAAVFDAVPGQAQAKAFFSRALQRRHR